MFSGSIPSLCLFNLVEEVQHESITTSVKNLLTAAFMNGLPFELEVTLCVILNRHVDIFRFSLSSGRRAQIWPLKIDLDPHAVPTLVKLRHYSQGKRDFLRKFVNDLQKRGYVYPNPTAKWASVTHLNPKPEPKRWRFTVDPRQLSRFTISHQILMP